MVAKAGYEKRVGTRYRPGCSLEEGFELDAGAVKLLRPSLQPRPGISGQAQSGQEEQP